MSELMPKTSRSVTPSESEANRYKKDPAYKKALDITNGMNSSVSVLMEKLEKNSQIFEFWVGIGRDAIPLADHGFIMHIQDLDVTKYPDLLKNIMDKNNERLLRSQGILDICIREPGEAKNCIISTQFDAFIAIRVLPFMRPVDALLTIEKMQTNTKPGGWNVINFFSNESLWYNERQKYPMRPVLDPFFPSVSEMESYYEGWTIIMERQESEGENLTEWSLVAQKPIFENIINVTKNNISEIHSR